MDYPWYGEVTGDELEQGQILENCPVFFPLQEQGGREGEIGVRLQSRDVILMSQSCDLVLGREKVESVLLCLVASRNELTKGILATPKGMEDARRGNLPAFHVLAACELPGHERAIRVVDFRQTYTLPVGFVRKQASAASSRIKLLPPYREHLAQAFARFFMRIGLPKDIPAFR